jgi:integrase
MRGLSHCRFGRRRFHASRHTAATLLLDEGVPLEVVSAVLGHASLAIMSTVSRANAGFDASVTDRHRPQ